MAGTLLLQSNKTQYLTRLLMTLDACLIALTFLLAIHFAMMRNEYGTEFFTRHLVFLLPLITASTFSLFYFGAYKSLTTPSVTSYFLAVLRGLTVGLVALLVSIFLLDIEYVSRLVIGTFMLLVLPTILGIRFFFIWWYFKRNVQSEINFHRMLIVGTGSRAIRMRELIDENSEWGISVVGHLDMQENMVGDDIDGSKVIGTIDQIHDVLRDNVVDEVMVAVPRTMLSSISSIAEACDEEGVELRVMADLFDMGASRIKLDLFAGVPLVSFAPVSFDTGKLLLKRMFDIITVLCAAPIIFPLMLLIAIAIRIDDGGPVLFVQDRVGLRKRKFSMFKFRSMVQDAEEQIEQLADQNEAEGPNFKMENDPRVTRVGRFLRRTSLDELPQLLNVLMGTMSLVGPRPMSVRDVDLFDQAVQRKRFSVVPGLTCIWQISGRSNLSFERWLELDLAYIDNWSLELDIRILLKTIPAVLFQKGAV